MNVFEQISPRCSHCKEHDAYHEAGHAVMAVITYRRIRRELYRFYLKRVEAAQALLDLGIVDDEQVEEAWDTLDKVTRGPVDEISIVPDAYSTGRTDRPYFLADRNLQDEADDPALRIIAEAEVQVHLAGFAAQRLFAPESVIGQEWGEDAARPMMILNTIDGEDHVDTIKDLLEETESTLLEPRVWPAVIALADLLVAKETVSGMEARGLIEKMVWD